MSRSRIRTESNQMIKRNFALHTHTHSHTHTGEPQLAIAIMCVVAYVNFISFTLFCCFLLSAYKCITNCALDEPFNYRFRSARHALLYCVFCAVVLCFSCTNHTFCCAMATMSDALANGFALQRMAANRCGS